MAPTTYVALLRAVNTSAGHKLPMAELRALAEEAGFGEVRTYIASGNLLFRSEASELKVKRQLERALAGHAGKTSEAVIRTAAEMRQVELENPFRDAPWNRIGVIFLDHPPPRNLEERGVKNEELVPGRREIYVHYPDGMGRSRLKIPVERFGTTRNLNTVSKLADLAGT